MMDWGTGNILRLLTNLPVVKLIGLDTWLCDCLLCFNWLFLLLLSITCLGIHQFNDLVVNENNFFGK